MKPSDYGIYLGPSHSGLHKGLSVLFTLQMSELPWWLRHVKNLLAVQETWVRSLGREGPLEKGMAAHPSILAWRIPWTEEPGGLQSMGSQSRTRLNN